MNQNARRSLLADGHPLSAALFLLTAVFLTMATFHPAVAVCSLFGALLLYGTLTNAKQAAKRLAFTLCAALLFALINPLLSHRGMTVLFTVFDTPFTLEAVLAGLCTAFSFCAAICWFSSFHLLLSSDRIIALTGNLLPTFTLLFSMVLRFVPMFKKRADRIADAQKAAFPNAVQSKWSRPVGILSVLSTWTLENGIDTADSMHARGYGTARRTNSGAQRFSRRDALFLLCAVPLSCGAFAAVFTGKLSVWFYPTFYLLPTDAFALAGLVCSVIFLLFAPIFTLWEVIRWRFSLSKR